MDEQPERLGTPGRGGDGKFTRTAETAERDARACELRGQGKSYRQISKELGYASMDGAYRAVQRCLAEIVAEPAAEALKMELERLDTMHAAAMRVLEGKHLTVSNGRVVMLNDQPLPDDGPVLQAIDRLVRISESRRKLLGLDAAKKVDVSGGVKYEVVGVDVDDIT